MAETIAKKPFLAIREFKVKSGARMAIGILQSSTICLGEHDAIPFPRMQPLINKLNSESKSSVSLIRPEIAHYALAGLEGGWKFFSDNNCTVFPTSVMVAHRTPKKKLGTEITFKDEGQSITFPVPKSFSGLSNHILIAPFVTSFVFALMYTAPRESDPRRVDPVAEPEFFRSAADGAITLAPRIVHACPLRIKSGLYDLHDLSQDAFPSPFVDAGTHAGTHQYCQVLRINDQDMVAPLVLQLKFNGERKHFFSLDCNPFAYYGVVVEIPQDDLGKFVSKSA
jgi:hypothetical protein